MTQKPPTWLATLGIAALALGCGGGGDSTDLDALAETLDAQAESSRAAVDAQAAAEDQRVSTPTPPARGVWRKDEPSAVTTDDMRRGQGLRGGGYLATSLRAGVVAEQRLNLFQVTHALNLYKAEHGRGPRRTKSSWRRSSASTASRSNRSRSLTSIVQRRRRRAVQAGEARDARSRERRDRRRRAEAAAPEATP